MRALWKLVSARRPPEARKALALATHADAVGVAVFGTRQLLGARLAREAGFAGAVLFPLGRRRALAVARPPTAAEAAPRSTLA